MTFEPTQSPNLSEAEARRRLTLCYELILRYAKETAGRDSLDSNPRTAAGDQSIDRRQKGV